MLQADSRRWRCACWVEFQNFHSTWISAIFFQHKLPVKHGQPPALSWVLLLLNELLHSPSVKEIHLGGDGYKPSSTELKAEVCFKDLSSLSCQVVVGQSLLPVPVPQLFFIQGCESLLSHSPKRTLLAYRKSETSNSLRKDRWGENTDISSSV